MIERVRVGEAGFGIVQIQTKKRLACSLIRSCRQAVGIFMRRNRPCDDWTPRAFIQPARTDQTVLANTAIDEPGNLRQAGPRLIMRFQNDIDARRIIGCLHPHLPMPARDRTGCDIVRFKILMRTELPRIRCRLVCWPKIQGRRGSGLKLINAGEEEYHAR